MEFFKKAKAIRLKSQHNKYMIADEDEQTIKQSRNGSSKNARWCVELVDGKPNVIRLKNSQTWNYMGATDDPFLLGMTGKRVSQASPRLKADASVEWEPIKEGLFVKLRAPRRGTYLRANGGIPPWNNSVTHDNLSSRSSTQDWTLWAVDVLDVVDHGFTEEVVIGESTVVEVGSKLEDNQRVVVDGGSSSLSRNSSTGSTISKADYYKDCYEVGSPVHGSSKSGRPVRRSNVNQVQQSNDYFNVDTKVKHQEEDSLSRNSSSASTLSKVDYYKDCSEDEVVSTGPKSVRSVRRSSINQNAATQRPKENPKVSEKPKRVSPLVQRTHNESRNSDSFNKLRSVLDGLGDLLDDEDDDYVESGDDSDHFAETKSHKPHALELQMAKHTLQELKGLDYETLLLSGKDKKLDEVVNVIITDAKLSARGQVPASLSNLQEQLKSMREEHDSATQDLEEYATFSTQRVDTRAELKKDAAKAHELETLEVGLSNMLTTARAKREELLKQLAEVENSIASTEKALSDNSEQIEELISSIGQKSENLRDIERKEKSWQARKIEAERTLKRVEEDWIKMQSLFQSI